TLGLFWPFPFLAEMQPGNSLFAPGWGMKRAQKPTDSASKSLSFAIQGTGCLCFLFSSLGSTKKFFSSRGHSHSCARYSTETLFFPKKPPKKHPNLTGLGGGG